MQAEIMLSIFEIYKEKVYDLLVPGNPKSLPIREDAYQNVGVVGLAPEKITSVEDFRRCFTKSMKIRKTAATALNQSSSRSHCIFQLEVQQKFEGCCVYSSKI